MALTDKQERFCLEYMVDLNATQAAIRAGYSPDTARQIGTENLSKPAVSDRVAELQAERAARTKIDADWVLKQAVKLYERCMDDIEPVMAAPGLQGTDGNGNPVWKFNSAGAAKSLELVGKHVNVQAFREQVAHSGEISLTVAKDDAAL